MSNRKRPRHLHLMADYGAAGVWDHDGTPLNPAKLPLSPRLRACLATLDGPVQKSSEESTSLPLLPRAARSPVR